MVVEERRGEEVERSMTEYVCKQASKQVSVLKVKGIERESQFQSLIYVIIWQDEEHEQHEVIFETRLLNQ